MRKIGLFFIIFFLYVFSFNIYFDYDNWKARFIKEPLDTLKIRDLDYKIKNYLRSLVYDDEKTLEEFLLLNPRLERRFNHLRLNYKEEKRSFLSDGSQIIEYSLSLAPDIFTIIAKKTGKEAFLGELACPLCKRLWPKDLSIPEGIKLIPYEDPNIIKEKYTGIIIDCRHLSLKPAIFPKIYNEDLKEVYSINFCDSLSLIENGLISYVKSLDSAYRHRKAGNFPLYISGLKIIGKNKCDIVISNKDALTLHNSLNNLKLLEKGRIIIVYKDDNTFER
ncbi:MAG: hypothetical protein RMJ34_02250 [candidate division WOR-3 bacterium]|nr:hypothetical protein [candidate division WOR-3 bacterium]MDW8113741.1 hypothetical protein [candidate division WOR-3 bacterium]